MFLLKRPQSKPTRIGLDLGESGVRAVQLARAGDEYILTVAAGAAGFGSHGPAGPGQSDNRREADTPDHMLMQESRLAHQVREIRSCLRKPEFRGRSVVVGLNTPDLEFHLLELPPAILSQQTPADPRRLKPEDREVAQVVHWEMTRLLEQSAENVETRHWQLPSALTPKANALGIGVKREVVSRTMATCARAGLVCCRVDAAAAALCRFGCLINPVDTRTKSRTGTMVWGLLDLGYRQSRLVLCVDEVPTLIRTAGSGGREWTQRIAGSLDLSVKAAEIHKRDHGIALIGRKAGQGQATMSPLVGDDSEKEMERLKRRSHTPSAELAAILFGVLRSDLNELAAEIKRSYEYVLSCHSDCYAGDLILVGGGAKMPKLTEFLGNALGIPVRRVSTYLEEDRCLLRVTPRARRCRSDCAADTAEQRSSLLSRVAESGPAQLDTLSLAIGLAIGH